MGRAERLPDGERKALQAVTIVMVAALVFLFFSQRIIWALVLGVAFLGAQRLYLHARQ